MTWFARDAMAIGEVVSTYILDAPVTDADLTFLRDQLVVRLPIEYRVEIVHRVHRTYEDVLVEIRNGRGIMIYIRLWQVRQPKGSPP